jgi:hypothetical protein
MKLSPFYLMLCVAATACGKIHLGQSVGNDPSPGGTIVASGAFVTQVSGKNVTGSVSVHLISGGDYVVRLASLNAPSESGLIVVAASTTQEYNVGGLKAPTGDENYPVTVAGGATWAYVVIRQPSGAIGSRDYGRANLTAPGP